MLASVILLKLHYLLFYKKVMLDHRPQVIRESSLISGELNTVEGDPWEEQKQRAEEGVVKRTLWMDFISL